MFNKFESALQKGMATLSTPIEKLAFRSFLAEACKQLDCLPTQAIINGARDYARRIGDECRWTEQEYAWSGRISLDIEDDIEDVVLNWAEGELPTLEELRK